MMQHLALVRIKKNHKRSILICSLFCVFLMALQILFPIYRAAKSIRKDLPVLFIAGAEDPVGPYGKGVEQAHKAFQRAGMVRTSIKLYPDCRHEILNETNRQEVYEDVLTWLQQLL